MLYNYATRSFETTHRLYIVTRRDEWMASLVGHDEEALAARAQRYSRAIIGSRVVDQEEMDAINSRLREGYIPINRRVAA